MLSKIVEVQGQLRHGSKRNKKRAGTKCDDPLLMTSVLTATNEQQ